MANRLIAYRVSMELERRRQFSGRRSHSLPEIANRLLRCLVVLQVKEGLSDTELRGWDDYRLATRAEVSVRQTAELYEEIGLGTAVREALDHLEQQGLVKVRRRPLSGPYRGFSATERGLSAVNLDPWYKRALAFFDPPRGS